MSSYDYTFKLLLLGDSITEKTAFTKRYCYNIFNPSERLTIGVDFHVKTIDLNDKKVKLQIWDVGGEEKFRFLLPTYCLGANAVFLLYDITQPQTLDNIADWTNIVRRKAGNIPIMLVGTKLDAENQRLVPREYGIQVAKKNELTSFAEVSAKTGQNVNKAFEVLTELTLNRLDGNDYIQSSTAPYEYVEKVEVDEEFIPFEFTQESKFASEPWFNTIDAEFVESSLINPVFKINEYLSLRLEHNKSNIYVSGKLFSQCKYLLLDISIGKSPELEKIESIDEAEAKLNKEMELDHSLIPSETEFWGHCSNLQAWYENNYDTRLLHRNLAFPLLRELVKVGDICAKKVFKEEVAKRLQSGYPSVVLYLIEEEYLNILNQEELDEVIENPKFLKNLSNWFTKKLRNNIPEEFYERIIKKLNNLHCHYCGCKIEQDIVQKVLNGKGIRCLYCDTCIIKYAQGE